MTAGAGLGLARLRRLARTALAGASVLAALLSLSTPVAAQTADHPVSSSIRFVSDAAGTKLQVDGRDFMVLGMNWGYDPIGENYAFNLFAQPDDVIEAALAREMSLLKGMGINTIKLIGGVPPRWIQYIYERYGIYTVLNHQMARYGFTVDGAWIPVVDYSDPRLREAVKAEILAMVEQCRGTPGLLMWLLGNENNYGLSWSSFEIEALPKGEQDAVRARYLYSMVEMITQGIKEIDSNHPVALANGDLQYIDIIAQECKSLDVMGVNVYRGMSARAGRTGLDRHGPLFEVVKANLGIPVLYTEFGADAWNAKEMREDQYNQARYLVGQWKELYEQSYGKGGVGNSIGGLIFQWSDGWWKYGQDSRLDIHDTHASWPNGAYPEDYVEGDNNMNEEWWGICAKGPPDSRHLYEVYPRAAYFALRRAFVLDPYAPGTDFAAIQAHFATIDPMVSTLDARGNSATLVSESLKRVRLSGLRLEIETVSTGGERITTPKGSTPSTGYPKFKGFDRMESFFADLQANPTENVTGTLSLNVLGNVPSNPIDEIFYENRGRRRTVLTTDGNFDLQGIQRVKVYRSGVSWDDRWFLLDGFYRTGHFHWGYEGDFFGLYREANYGENIDVYNSDAPIGVEMSGKRQLNGLKLAYGPQLWWGANPALMLKYQRGIGRVQATAIVQTDLTEQTSLNSSSAIPLPPTKKATLHLATKRGPIGVEVGGIWAGDNKIGDAFQVLQASNTVLLDDVREIDTFGIKGKVTYEKGRYHWYAQAASMGLVADGGPTSAITYTGWHLKDSGMGNQRNFLTGLAVSVGNFQIAPNVLWQKPMVGPIPGGLPEPGRPRNIFDDPFAVRANREMVGKELLLVYDPTPGTWMYQWDNDIREDARLAGSVGLVQRDMKTTQDASIGIFADGVNTFIFPGAPPARTLWELHARVVSRLRSNIRIVAHAFAGTGEPNGSDTRLVGAEGARRFGADARVAWGSIAVETYAKFNDWGPYDYHRDGNLTFPAQLMGDVSYTLGTPQWFGYPQTSIGLRGTWRSLDQFSPRFNPDGTTANGTEWEVRTYLHLAL